MLGLLVQINAENVTNKLQVWIQKDIARTVTLKMGGKRILKQDSVIVLILSISKVEIFVKPVINLFLDVLNALLLILLATNLM